jgi:hypothetical protein
MAFPVGWLRRCPLTVNHTKVTGNLTLQPEVLTELVLPAEMMTAGDPNAAQSDGGDIRFSTDAAGASQIGCDIVGWAQNANPAIALAEIWIPVSVLSASDVVVYVWYSAGGGLSQPAAGAAFGSQSVYDSDYVAVNHFGTPSSLGLGDATSRGNSLTSNDAVNAVATTGKLGGGLSVPGAAPNVRLYKNSPTAFPTGSAVMTIEVWAKDLLHDTGIVGWGNWGSGAVVIYQNSNLAMDLINDSGGVQSFAFANGAGVWRHFAFTLPTPGGNMGNVIGYLNGAAQSSAGSSGSVAPTGTQWRVTGLPNITTNSNIFQGLMDEARVSKVARSANWMSTQYNNQNDPATFWSVGTPVTPGAAGFTVFVAT